VSHFQKGDKVCADVATDSDVIAAENDPIKFGNAPKITSTPPQALRDDRHFVYNESRARLRIAEVRTRRFSRRHGDQRRRAHRVDGAVEETETVTSTRRDRVMIHGGYSTQEFSIATMVQSALDG
jgi:hypothetical protein